MTAPADRHRVLRAALTAAIRLTGAVRDRRAAAVSEAAWRVVEPALAQRDAQLDAVRALHHDWDADPGHCSHCTTGDGALVTYPCPTIRALDIRQQSDPRSVEGLTREDRYRQALPTLMTDLANDLTALLPDEARAAGIHFAFAIDTTTEN